MSKRRVELYGRLRDLGFGNAVLIDIDHSFSARLLLSSLSSLLGSKPSVLKGCVLATEDSVLSPNDAVPKHGRLAILPPVCGG